MNTKKNMPPNEVAPFAGAWIETVLLICNFLRRSVAPFAGAWIETGGGG